MNFIKKKIRRAKFKKKWFRKNKHNLTTPVNAFDMDKVSVGKGSYGPIEVYAWGDPEERLIIGNFCSIAKGVKFVLGGNHFFNYLSNYPWAMHFGGEVQPAATNGPIIIEAGVWIGMDAMILSGVRVGQGAIIGARAVIAKDVPPYAVVVGNPGKIVSYRFDEKVIARLLAFDFYNKIDTDLYEANKTLLNQPLSEEMIHKLADSFGLSDNGA